MELGIKHGEIYYVYYKTNKIKGIDTAPKRERIILYKFDYYMWSM